MRRVILESPYAGARERNVAYARQCVRDSLLRGESPIASHLLYTQDGILDDDIPSERAHGIAAGLAWADLADAVVFYTDLGMSAGMLASYQAAVAKGLTIEKRSLPATQGEP